MKLHLVAAGLVLALSAALVVAEDKTAVKSGPQVGDDLAGPFHPLNVNGKQAGKKHCLYCENGSNPVVMIFAREPNAQLGKLIKKVDAACTAHSKEKLNSFVVFCTKDEEAETKAKKCAKDCDLKKVVLSIDNPSGPKDYNFNEKADVTVILYVDRNVKANYTFKKDEMKDKDVDAIVKDLSKILPKS
jgi:hypothetical protein